MILFISVGHDPNSFIHSLILIVGTIFICVVHISLYDYILKMA